MDVLLVVVDDVGLADFADPSLTPRVAALRAEGRDCTLALSHPLCSQSRLSLRFGVYGRSVGIVQHIDPTDPAAPIPPVGLPTLAGELSAAGYATALVGKWHCGGNPSGGPYQMAPIARGYQAWRAGIASSRAESYYAWDRVDADEAGYAQFPETLHAAVAQVEAAESWWAAHAGQPRFLEVALNLAHGPFHVPPSSLLAGYVLPPSPSKRDKFLAMVRAADTVIGRLLDMPGASEALVVVVSDNGTSPNVVEDLAQQDRLKGTTLDGGIRVPLVIRGPGVAAGPYGELLHVVDVPRAILGFVGRSIPPSWDGLLFRSYAISEAVLPANGRLDQCLRTRYQKLRRVLTPGLLPVEEFYDLVADPQELSPVASPPPSVLASMRDVLYDWPVAS